MPENTHGTQLDIPKQPIPIYYKFDPETEILVDGDKLAPGMIVALWHSSWRGDPDDIDPGGSQSEMTRTLQLAWWCRVENLYPQRGSDYLISFTGVYADGSMAPRTSNVSYTWIVKKASIPS